MTILITRHDKIGDFVTAIPMCKVLKEQTSHRVIMMVSKINVDLAKSLDFIDDVIEYSDDTFILLERINRFKPDVSISGYIDNHLGLCLFLARINIRIAPATKMAQLFFNSKVKQRRSRVEKTEFEYNLDLLKEFDDTLELEFKKPLVDFKIARKNMVIFHVGFGGSSDGNLSLDEYLSLGKVASSYSEVVFTFGPDDSTSKEYITKHMSFCAKIRDDFSSLVEFTKFIACSKLFVSTSTGPMHLAGLTNTPTLSFFGKSAFASSKRWATISDKNCQNNYEIPANYGKGFYQLIENKMLDLI